MNKGKKKQQLYYSDILYKYKNRDRLGKKKDLKTEKENKLKMCEFLD